MGNLSNINNKFIVVDDGNVLIGATSTYPQGNNTILKLYSPSIPRFYLQNTTTGSNVTDGSQFYVSSSDLYITNSESANIILSTGATPRMTIDSSGNVGIGTTSPGTFYPGNHNLVVGDGNADSAITVYANSANTSYLLFADGTSGGSSYASQVRYNHSTNHMEFATNDSTVAKMTLDDNGNVGIGTTSNISSPLTIQTNQSANSISIIGRNNGANDEAVISFYEYDGTTRNAYIIKEAGNLGFATGTGGSATERMRIDSSGKVTIGTGIINPSIGSDIAITQGSIGLRINDAASAISPTTATANNDNAVDLGVSNIRFRNLYMGGNATFGGNVGIGTTSPDAQLEISNPDTTSGAGGATLRLTRADSTSVAGDPVGTIEFYSTDADTPKTTAYIKSMSEELYGRQGSLAFGVSQSINADATEAMRITSGGHIEQGIVGTTASAYYYFNGSTSSDTGLLFRDNTSSNSGFLTYNHSVDAMKFGTGGSERMRITGGTGAGEGSTMINYTNYNIQTYGSGAYSGKLIVKAHTTTPNAAITCLNGNVGGDNPVFINFVNEFVANQYNYLARIAAAPENTWTGTASTRNASLNFYTNNAGISSERMRIDSSGNVGIGTTNADSKLKVEATSGGSIYAGFRVGYNQTSNNYYDADTHHFRLGTGSSAGGNLMVGGGVYLGGTAADNRLDDYEEGTWTPVIAHNNGTGVVPLNVATARYVKVGKLVYIACYLTSVNPNGNAGGSGAYYGIRGFPFAPENYGVWQMGYASSSITAYGGYSSAASLYFMANGTNGQRSQAHVSGAQVNAWGSSVDFMMNCVYRIN